MIYGGLSLWNPQGLEIILIFPNHVTIVFDFHMFQEAVEMVHCGSIPTTIYGRVDPLPLPLEFAFASLCCQNISVYESFVDMWSFAFIGACLSSKFLEV